MLTNADAVTTSDGAGQEGDPRPLAFDASILVLGYNSKSYLDACFRAIPAAAARHSVEVLFVNNGSDDSESFIAAHHPHVRVLKSNGNVGFGEANNRMARHARGRWIVLLNPDTEVYPGAIDRLIETAQANPDFWILGGLTVDADGTFRQKSYPELPSLRSILRGLIGKGARPLHYAPDAPVVQVEAINGGFLLASRERWDQLRGFDETYFLYGEDNDLSFRVGTAGGLVGLVPASKVYHDVGSGNALSPLRKYFIAVSDAHYFRRNRSRPYALAAIMLLWIGHVVRYGAGLSLSAWKPRFKAMSIAYRRTALKPWCWMRGFETPGADPRRAQDLPRND